MKITAFVIAGMLAFSVPVVAQEEVSEPEVSLILKAIDRNNDVSSAQHEILSEQIDEVKESLEEHREEARTVRNFYQKWLVERAIPILGAILGLAGILN